MRIHQIVESTTAGSVASVAMPLGGTQKRAGSMFKGKKTKKKFYEGEMKRIATDMEELSDAQFKKKYGKTKEEMRKGLREEEIIETDLILMPGQIKGKDKSFVAHDKDRTDHEVEMARSELYAAAKDAQRIYKMIQNRSEDEGLMGWQQSYITLASDYLNSVADSLEHQAATEGAGVIAGGAGNLEEGETKTFKPNKEDGKTLELLKNLATQKPKLTYREMKSIGKESLIDDAIKASKNVRNGYSQNNQPNYAQFFYNLENDLDHFKRGYNASNYDPVEYKPLNLAFLLDGTLGKIKFTKDLPETKCPKCGGPSYSEESIAEAKDACYHKVKSRYKVWPSAYASGALVKCRKVGASNWGNKSKK